MDKNYKVHFLSQLKARMRLDRAEFVLAKVPKDHPERWRFAGSVLYVRELPTRRCVWLEWIPADGIEREFFAFLGWSFAAATLPSNPPGDMRIHSIREPSPGFASGVLNVQGIEGRPAVAGFRIDTPWEQLYRLSPRATDAERKRVMNKAHAQYLAVTEAERVDAVRVAMNEAFASVAAVLPGFTAALERLPPGDV